MSLLVLGTIALDNVKTPFGTRRNIIGGSAVHFCMSARLFTNVSIVGVVGDDFSKKDIRLLKQKGIGTSGLQIVKGKTFRWHGAYKKEDMNTALTLATKLGVITTSPVNIPERLRRVPYVFLANIDPDQQVEVLNLMRSPKLVGLDSMNLWITHKKRSLLRLMKRVDLFVANDGEVRMLTGEQNLIKATQKLLKLGPEIIVVKKGEHGVLCHSNKFMFSYPAYPVDAVIDPTGAGDTFAGGLMGYLSHSKRITEKTLKQAVLYATTIASFNVQGFGIIKTSSLRLPVVRRRMKELIGFFSL